MKSDVAVSALGLFGEAHLFGASNSFGAWPPTRGSLVRPLAAHAKELEESFKMSYGRPPADKEKAVSIR